MVNDASSADAPAGGASTASAGSSGSATPAGGSSSTPFTSTLDNAAKQIQAAQSMQAAQGCFAATAADLKTMVEGRLSYAPILRAMAGSF